MKLFIGLSVSVCVCVIDMHFISYLHFIQIEMHVYNQTIAYSAYNVLHTDIHERARARAFVRFKWLRFEF